MDNHTTKYLIRRDYKSLPLFFYTAIDGMGHGKPKLKTVLEIFGQNRLFTSSVKFRTISI